MTSHSPRSPDGLDHQILEDTQLKRAEMMASLQSRLKKATDSGMKLRERMEKQTVVYVQRQNGHEAEIASLQEQIALTSNDSFGLQTRNLLKMKKFNEIRALKAASPRGRNVENWDDLETEEEAFTEMLKYVASEKGSEISARGDSDSLTQLVIQSHVE